MRRPIAINVRGTSGSGKSTVARQIMALYERSEPVHVEGRKRPIQYVLKGVDSGHPDLAVIGHYETACGGCDTISKDDTGRGNSADRIFGLIQENLDAGRDVLFEGLLVSGDVTRCRKLRDDGYDLTVVALDLTVEECLASVRARRLARGNEKPLKEDNTRRTFDRVRKTLPKLRAGGVPVLELGRAEAAARIATILGFDPAALLAGEGVVA